MGFKCLQLRFLIYSRQRHIRKCYTMLLLSQFGSYIVRRSMYFWAAASSLMPLQSHQAFQILELSPLGQLPTASPCVI